MLQFPRIPSIGELVYLKENDEMILYESFTMINPQTRNTFPESDEPYYTSLEMQLRHLLYKYDKGWISSERQVMLSSDECISAVHFIFDNEKRVIGINVFQRSSNLFNLEDDVQFFNYFINKYLRGHKKIKLTYFVSQPHIFKNKNKKIED
ncbi:hypothetical protein [Bacillus subtilis]|uniref:hypothetical protein n=1 Tax=Bacillus subtilis TaxID=1423 RepID=UPI00237BA220|nr:hypothetical protein [Bacillus subtilis]MDD9768022.1 hypothetical protein [Bacillus subtilis]MDD9771363.1 hypothetical protein [Bacillus subtilis]MDD9775622.1 hypothetical protein [Bacillus subtilis]MDD9779923.1 hypothetical protein [Bacillus subtilis]MDD9787447.1 hypothetical protein [Bacillus subtilis]